MRSTASSGWSRARVLSWGVDFSDDVAMTGLRARVSGVLLVVGVSLALAARLVNPSAFARASGSDVWLLLVAFAALGCWVLWRGRRLGDLAYLGVHLASQILLILLLSRIQGPGSYLSWELALLCPTLTAAVFFVQRWHVAVQVVSAVAAASWLVWLRVGPTGQAPAAAIGEVFAVVVVAVIVRLLRDLAHDALAEARRGEVTDPLTGLANRRGLERYGGRTWEQQARRGQPIAVLIADIDHFKQVNDTRGHTAGDELIRQVAELLNASLRRDDVAVRLGGEEFLVLAQAPPGEAEVFAERLRAAFEEALYPVTVSIGVYETLPGAADPLPASLWRAVDIADRALYDAKRAGRNRVVSAR
ncbi:MAG: GGDEF domain-containing protein [Kineosporiaceae bacterium]